MIFSENRKSNIQIVDNYLKLIKSKQIINENIVIFIKDICEFIAEEEIQYTKIDEDYFNNLKQNKKSQKKFMNKYNKNILKPIRRDEIINLLTEFFLRWKKG